MERVTKYLPDILTPSKIKKNLVRFFKIHINPPKESQVFLEPEKLTEITRQEAVINTKEQPKQVVYDDETSRAYVSCMEGRTLQIFKVQDNTIQHETDIEFTDQCVEVLLGEKVVFVTTTNFARPPQETRNKLWIIDRKTLQTRSSLENTGGNWNKLMAIRPQGDELLISNWHSHDISVIDIKDINKPQLKQILHWGEAPRGIAFLKDGDTAIVTGFYSGNLGVLSRNKDGWFSSYTSEPFDRPHYAGNMRHVLISPDNKTAIVSNLGRNLLHFWGIESQTFEDNISVGKSPNSIDFIKNSPLIAVSCRASSYVYLVDSATRKVIGRSHKTGEEPTGLCGVDSGFLVTDFKSNKLELHTLNI